MLHCECFTNFPGLRRKNGGEKRKKKGKDRDWKRRQDYNSSSNNRNNYNKSKCISCAVWLINLPTGCWHLKIVGNFVNNSSV